MPSLRQDSVEDMLARAAVFEMGLILGQTRRLLVGLPSWMMLYKGGKGSATLR